MKIYSRPPAEDDDVLMGSGQNVLMLTDEQLELVTALVCSCRLGHHAFATAAYEIIDMIETQYGNDWMHAATEKVDPQVSVEDARGSVVFNSIPGLHHITLEV